jgi:hypothetical protein
MEVAERNAHLWVLAASPGIWAAHFALSYATAAVWCAKAPDADAPLLPVRIAIGCYTAAGLVAVGIVGALALRRHLEAPRSHGDTPGDRHRFLGFATVLLSGLSAIAILFETLVAVFVETCR